MAEIEATEHGDHGKAREWALRAMRAKRDPAWVADGYVTDEWMPASPSTGKLDAFVWSAPPRSRPGRCSNRRRRKPWRWCRREAGTRPAEGGSSAHPADQKQAHSRRFGA